MAAAAIPNMAAAAIPIVAAVGGALLQRQALAQANEARTRQILRMQELARRANRENAELIERGARENYDPAPRLERYEKTADQAERSLGDYVTAIREKSAGPDYSGRVSKDFLVERGKRDAANLAEAHKWARLMGRMRAMGDMMTEEGIRNADNAAQRAGLASDLRSRMGVEELKLGAIQPSSTLMLLGDIMQMGGMAYGMKSGAGSAGGTPAPQGKTGLFASLAHLKQGRAGPRHFPALMG